MSNALFGELKSETLSKENSQCREIVHELVTFGISQRQMLMVMYLMSMELENNAHMLAMTSLIKELGGDTLFVKKTEEECNG